MSRYRPPDELRTTFQTFLGAAVTVGTAPKRHGGLGPRTIDAIEAIAREHPDASVRRITEAHEAFFAEHLQNKPTTSDTAAGEPNGQSVEPAPAYDVPADTGPTPRQRYSEVRAKFVRPTRIRQQFGPS